jgi:predicted ribosome quality control (RQC) complex YloA/Tae2 family protein
VYIDAFTISALVDEFMDTIVGGRIQNSVLVDATGIGLEVYANRKRHYLYLSADNQAPRVHLVDAKLRRGPTKPSQLALLVRRYVEGGRLTHVSQPPHERILQFDISHPAEGDSVLIVEPMPRRSNVILVKDDMILDSARRVGPEDNRYRITLPAHEYVPPPPMTGRIDPATLTRENVYEIFEQNQKPERETYRLIGSRIYGFSKLMGREVVYLATGDTETPSGDAAPDAIYDALSAFLAPLNKREWRPGIVVDGDEVAAFSVYPVTHLEGWRPVETVSEAMTHYFGMPSGPDGYKIAKKPVREMIQEARIREGAKLTSLQKGLKDDAELEHLKQSGELILAYQYTLEDGQKVLRAQYDPEGEELEIKLDTQMSPLENAQNYFRKYEKAKRALEGVPELVVETEQRLDYLTQLETDLDLAGDWVDIDEVRQELKSLGYWQGKAPQRIAGGGRQSSPMRLLLGDGFVTWLGRNSRQNDVVTFGKGGGDDLWLHARDVPGSHVVIKYDGRQIPEDVIMQAAQIAAYYSKRRTEASVIVDVTQCKYVRKIKGAAPGMVTYRNEETRNVIPASEAEFDL